jgi:hypothetical protein
MNVKNFILKNKKIILSIIVILVIISMVFAVLSWTNKNILVYDLIRDISFALTITISVTFNFTINVTIDKSVTKIADLIVEGDYKADGLEEKTISEAITITNQALEKMGVVADSVDFKLRNGFPVPYTERAKIIKEQEKTINIVKEYAAELKSKQQVIKHKEVKSELEKVNNYVGLFLNDYLQLKGLAQNTMVFQFNSKKTTEIQENFSKYILEIEKHNNSIAAHFNTPSSK